MAPATCFSRLKWEGSSACFNQSAWYLVDTDTIGYPQWMVLLIPFLPLYYIYIYILVLLIITTRYDKPTFHHQATIWYDKCQTAHHVCVCFFILSLYVKWLSRWLGLKLPASFAAGDSFVQPGDIANDGNVSHLGTQWNPFALTCQTPNLSNGSRVFPGPQAGSDLPIFFDTSRVEKKWSKTEHIKSTSAHHTNVVE